MNLFPLAAAAIALQGSALVTEVAKSGGKLLQAQVLAPATEEQARDPHVAPGLACGMTTPVGGTAPGIGGTKLLGKTLQQCLDECLARSCAGIISHHHGVKDCYITGRQYDSIKSGTTEWYIPSTSTTPAYVSNKVAGANCETTYDFLFYGCPRANGLTDWRKQTESMKMWECQAACDSAADCVVFETNGCSGNPNCGGDCWTFHHSNPEQLTITNGECQTNGDQITYRKVSTTPSPTAAPTTASPTVAPTTSPTPPLAAMGADLVGDPHVTNLAGRRFDVHYAGNLMLLQVPRGAEANTTLLRLDGHMKKIHSVCSKQLYLDSVNFTGKWVLERNGADLTIAARKKLSDATRPKHKQRFQLGGVNIVLSHAQTDTGITYLNLHASNLGRLGMPVGGLLGEDDFSWASGMPAGCQAEDGAKAGLLDAHVGSVLVASAL